MVVAKGHCSSAQWRGGRGRGGVGGREGLQVFGAAHVGRGWGAGGGAVLKGGGGRVCNANRNECSQGHSLLRGQDMGRTQDHRNNIKQWLAVGGGWQLAAVGGWRLVVVGSWRLAVGGGWWRLAVGGGWRLAVGGWRLVVPRGCPEKKKPEFLRTALARGGGGGGRGGFMRNKQDEFSGVHPRPPGCSHQAAVNPRRLAHHQRRVAGH